MLWIAPSEKDTDNAPLEKCRRDAADTATRVSAKPQPRSHLAGLLRSERQLLANPPFNDSDWFRKDDDVRWQFSVPPKGNANFARTSVRNAEFELRNPPRLAPRGISSLPTQSRREETGQHLNCFQEGLPHN